MRAQGSSFGRKPPEKGAAAQPDRRSALHGPIPLDWLSVAARLPGKSLHVGIALWFTQGLQGDFLVSLPNTAGLPFGFDRNAKYRALTWLEDAKLIAVERKLGRSPKIAILTEMGAR